MMQMVEEWGKIIIDAGLTFIKMAQQQYQQKQQQQELDYQSFL
jgi:hypothetical protein